MSRSARLSTKTRPIKHGAAVRAHHTSANFDARVFFQTSEELRAGKTAIAQIRFEAPVFIFAGDRFVIRDVLKRARWPAALYWIRIEARGEIFGSAGQREFLFKRAQALYDAGVFAATEIARDRAVKG